MHGGDKLTAVMRAHRHGSLGGALAGENLVGGIFAVTAVVNYNLRALEFEFNAGHHEWSVNGVHAEVCGGEDSLPLGVALEEELEVIVFIGMRLDDILPYQSAADVVLLEGDEDIGAVGCHKLAVDHLFEATLLLHELVDCAHLGVVVGGADVCGGGGVVEVVHHLGVDCHIVAFGQVVDAVAFEGSGVEVVGEVEVKLHVERVESLAVGALLGDLAGLSDNGHCGVEEGHAVRPCLAVYLAAFGIDHCHNHAVAVCAGAEIGVGGLLVGHEVADSLALAFDILHGVGAVELKSVGFLVELVALDHIVCHRESLLLVGERIGGVGDIPYIFDLRAESAADSLDGGAAALDDKLHHGVVKAGDGVVPHDHTLEVGEVVDPEVGLVLVACGAVHTHGVVFLHDVVAANLGARTVAVGVGALGVAARMAAFMAVAAVGVIPACALGILCARAVVNLAAAAPSGPDFEEVVHPHILHHEALPLAARTIAI